MSELRSERRYALTLALMRFGMRMSPSHLSERELERIEEDMEAVLRMQEGVPTQILLEAIEHGMPKVWPFSDDNRPFDSRDLKRNMTKAKAAASTLRQAGRIPIDGRESRRRFEAMVLEHGGDDE